MECDITYCFTVIMMELANLYKSLSFYDGYEITQFPFYIDYESLINTIIIPVCEKLGETKIKSASDIHYINPINMFKMFIDKSVHFKTLIHKIYRTFSNDHQNIPAL